MSMWFPMCCVMGDKSTKYPPARQSGTKRYLDMMMMVGRVWGRLCEKKAWVVL